MTEKNFGYLGTSFQQGLLKTIIEDKKFAITIIDSIDSKYFDGPYFKYIMANIKELYKLYGKIPSYDTLHQKIMKESRDATIAKVNLDTLENIKNKELEDDKYIKDTSLNFCKQQVLKKALKVSEEIMNNGEFENYNKIEDVIREALQVGSTTDDVQDISKNIKESLQKDCRVPFPTGVTGIDNLLKGGLARGELAIFLAPTGIGKALGISEPILYPTGWKTMREVKLGDKIVGSDGGQQYVIGIYPQGVRPIYRVEFTDGTTVNCDEEHLWSVNTLNMRTAKIRRQGNIIFSPNLGYKVMKTSELMKDIKKRGRYNYRLPTISPVEFENKDVLIDPYLLGVLLGDGSITDSGIRIDTKDDEIFDNIKHLGLHTSYNEYHRTSNTSIKNIKRIHFKNKDINSKLKYYGLLNKKSNNKFIPNDYIYNSLNVRLELLRGLLDTDGYISKRGTIQYSTVSEELCRNVREIVLSLGGTARINTKTPKFTYKNERKNGQKCYMITISFANNINPFKLIRKNILVRNRNKYKEQKFIKSITYSHDEEAICIKVSNSDELFVTRDFVLTHNTTWLTKVANSAFNVGANVLHIIFEDNISEVRKKHYTIWTGIPPDQQFDNQEEVVKVVEEITDRPNFLKLLKLPGFGVSVADIKSKIRKLEAEGSRVDVLVIDYVDCISLEKSIDGEEWKGEGTIMRSLEAMTDEFNICIWTATQGNRDSIASDVVTTDQMGGSIKKAQVGHVVISAAKTLEQKEHNLANVTLLKSRIGKDGVVFTNCKFDNEYLQIDTETQTTLLGHEEERAEAKKQRAADVYKDSMERRLKIKQDVEEKSDRLKLESAVSKVFEENEKKKENLNLLNNFEKEVEVITIPKVESIEDVVPNNINKDEDLRRKRAAEVYKTKKSSK